MVLLLGQERHPADEGESLREVPETELPAQAAVDLDPAGGFHETDGIFFPEGEYPPAPAGEDVVSTAFGPGASSRTPGSERPSDVGNDHRPDCSTRIMNPHALEPSAVAHLYGVDPQQGLSSVQVDRLLSEHGPNVLEGAPSISSWQRVLHQLSDRLILILISAAVVAFVVSGELKTPVIVLMVVALNTTLGVVQEQRAEKSLETLRTMLIVRSRTRRNGDLTLVDAADLVPGDVVLLEAGDRVPADGRLTLATDLEIEEAALTGESVPSTKSIAPVAEGAPVGDRSSMVFMNTTVTRGKGEVIVTSTGMRTEIGHVAHLLRSTETEPTPLQKQLSGLASQLARLAGVIVALVVIIGLIRGRDFGDVALTAVALAVASIPEGLPAVTAVTLALGVARMARHQAIVKRLASVETLGCTSVVCSDKTGTLTMNQMTAVEVALPHHRYEVSGEGFGAHGVITPVDGGTFDDLTPLLTAVALCNDAVVAEQVVGDPTEAALVDLARKGGMDVASLRRQHPRLGEVPFDSATKLMATVHEVPGANDTTQVRLMVKGAPDVLLSRCAPDDRHLEVLQDANRSMGDNGWRVLAAASRTLDPATWQAVRQAPGELAALLNDLTPLGLVGIVDPPRPEVAEAIALAHSAGVRVKMITGDHAATAAAIGAELGLAGHDRPLRAMSGAELDRLDDDELTEVVDDVDVFARVSPEHKLRLVHALQRRGEVVAMTGDGVNDAPALKRADMGIAMGIAGTEVTKEAATMVLADDRFDTIVEAIERGRNIYDNIVKFVRFQLSTTLGFAILFLLSSVLGVAGGAPFTALAILWVNIIMDGPPAMALGIDPAHPDTMRRRPRPSSEPILTRERWAATACAATTMALGTLAVLAWAPGPEPEAGTTTVAGTMAFTTFVLFQAFNLLNVRNDRATALQRHSLANRWLWGSVAAVSTLQVLVTLWGPLQRLFDVTSLTVGEWVVCVGVASTVLVVEELRKLVRRRRPIPVATH